MLCYSVSEWLTWVEGEHFVHKTASAAAVSAPGTALGLSDTGRQLCQHSTGLPWHHSAVTLALQEPTQTHRNTHRDRHRNRKTDRQQQTYKYSREFSHPQSLIKHKTNRHSSKDRNIKSLAKSIKRTAFSFKKQYQNLRVNAIVIPSSKHCFLREK